MPAKMGLGNALGLSFGERGYHRRYAQVPATFAKLMARRNICEVRFIPGDDDTNIVEYRPWSPQLEAESKAIGGGDWTNEGFAHLLAASIVSWDFKRGPNDEGIDPDSPYPITAEALAPFHYDVLAAIVQQLSEDQKPGKASA